MKMVECSGSPRETGRQTGEELREEIDRHLEGWIRNRDAPGWETRLPVFLDSLKQHLPDVLAEMNGLAEGANVAPDEIYRLNLPLYPDDLRAEGCTNVVFTGPDGPVWGKNNDGLAGEPRPVSARRITPSDGVPLVVFTFCGMISTCDGMNAEGLAVGHSSVGSVFQQSDRFPPIRLWEYHVWFHARTVDEWLEGMTRVPLRGKGYSMVVADRHGTAVSVEAPCPVIQVRRPAGPAGVYCVNRYYLPHLPDADRRSPEGKADATSRGEYLDGVLGGDGPFDVERMKTVLRNHDGQAVCRHSENSVRHETEYSMIACPAEGRLLYLQGRPCENEFTETSV